MNDTIPDPPPRKKVARFVLLALGILLAVLGGAYLLIQRELAKVCMSEPQVIAFAAEHGEPIVAAVRAYRAEHHEFPPDLEALAPKYLPNPPSLGWLYEADGEDSWMTHRTSIHELEQSVIYKFRDSAWYWNRDDVASMKRLDVPTSRPVHGPH